MKVDDMVFGFNDVRFECPIRFNGLPVSDERCGQFG